MGHNFLIKQPDSGTGSNIDENVPLIILGGAAVDIHENVSINLRDSCCTCFLFVFYF